MEIGILNYIREIRKEKNVTQEEMASFLGMKTNTYAAIEKGITRMRLEDLLLICKKLDIDPLLLIKNQDEIVITLNAEQINLLDNLNQQIQKQAKIKKSIETNSNSKIRAKNIDSGNINMNNVNISGNGNRIGSSFNQEKKKNN